MNNNGHESIIIHRIERMKRNYHEWIGMNEKEQVFIETKN